MGFVDRLTTIVVTATLTSAAWIVAGSGMLGRPLVFGERAAEATRQAPAARSVAKPATRPSGIRAASGLVLPVAGVEPDELVDTFTAARAGGARVHDAIDIMAPRGTPVLAAGAGVVEKLFLSDAGGKTIYVRSPDRREIHYYAHLDAYAPGLREGQVIAPGQQIGTVGSTGNADPAAPHLHFAVLDTVPTAKWWEPTTAVNPYPLLGGR